MYVAPNSTIQLFKNLKLDSAYANTLWFPNVESQKAFFADKAYATYRNVSYQRKDRGVIRLEARIENVYDITYLRYMNESFENKWFYAFVTSVEYVNNETVNIYFTIDVIQTYMFDWVLEQCLIERQHSVTDVAGDNLEIEGLELGDVIPNGEAYLWSLSSGAIYMGVAIGSDDDTFHTLSVLCGDGNYTASEDTGGYGMLNGLPTGVPVFRFVIDGSDLPLFAFRQAIGYLQNKNQIDSIAFVVYAPNSIMDFGDAYYPNTETREYPRSSSLDGYTPINKKVLTYPYRYLEISNDQNESMELRYELLGSNNFNVSAIMCPTPEVVLTPELYEGTEDNQKYALSISGFPFVSYADNGYKAWLAMNYDNVELSRELANKTYELNGRDVNISRDINRTNLSLQLSKDAVNLIGATQRKDPVASAVGIGKSIIGAVESGANYYFENKKLDLQSERNELELYGVNQKANIAESVARKLPNSPNVGNNSSSMARQKKGFYFRKMSVRRRIAEKVDKFFTMFGYAQNIVGVPNLHVRENFTYVKTNGSSISGSIPQDDKEVINIVFDRGIRFWVNYNNFEDYSVSNNII